MDITFKPIGFVRTDASDDQTRDEKKGRGRLEILPEFEDALEGIDGFSHLFVLVYFHKLRADQIGPLKVRPRRLVRRGFKLEDLPYLGVFALDSPTRPNPVGLSLVELLRRERNVLFVDGVDVFDGTPILDVKAYSPDYRAERFQLPDWYHTLMDHTGHI
jgi:tRNA-Thr(GGU) m(6)t(6)A37 methyltransferase TsaA